MRVHPRRLFYNVTRGTGATEQRGERNDFKIKPGKKGRTNEVRKREMTAIGFTNIADFSFPSLKNDGTRRLVVASYKPYVTELCLLVNPFSKRIQV